MAAITAAVNRDRTDNDLMMIPMDTGAGTIPKGAIVCNDATGYGVNGADTADYVFKGIATETKVFAGSSDGDTEIKVERTGTFRFAFGAGNAAITSEGVALYITDNNTVDLAGTTTKDVKVGIFAKFISTTEVWVRIDESVDSVGLS